MPRPPPPAAAFTSTGRSAAVTSRRGSSPISSLARVLEAIASIASGGGPIHTSPASSTWRAKSGFSERNPYPGCTASAPAARAASTIRSPRR